MKMHPSTEEIKKHASLQIAPFQRGLAESKGVLEYDYMLQALFCILDILRGTC